MKVGGCIGGYKIISNLYVVVMSRGVVVMGILVIVIES